MGSTGACVLRAVGFVDEGEVGRLLGLSQQMRNTASFPSQCGGECFEDKTGQPSVS